MTVGENRGKGRHGGRGKEPEQRHEPNGSRSTRLVGVNREGDDVGPLACDGADSRELEPP